MTVRKFLAFLFIPALCFPGVVLGQAHDASVGNHQLHYYDVADWDIQPSDVTYADHIAPILQRSCVQCHRPGGGGPMSFTSYEEVRPWAPVIMYRTAIRYRI